VAAPRCDGDSARDTRHAHRNRGRSLGAIAEVFPPAIDCMVEQYRAGLSGASPDRKSITGRNDRARSWVRVRGGVADLSGRIESPTLDRAIRSEGATMKVPCRYCIARAEPRHLGRREGGGGHVWIPDLTKLVVAPAEHLAARAKRARVPLGGSHGEHIGETRHDRGHVSIDRGPVSQLREAVGPPASDSAVGNHPADVRPPQAQLIELKGYSLWGLCGFIRGVQGASISSWGPRRARIL
jgi:hypothetical protein